MMIKLIALLFWVQENIFAPFFDDCIWLIGKSLKRLVEKIPYLFWLSAPITYLIQHWVDAFIPLEEVQFILTSILLIIELIVLLIGLIVAPMTMLHWLLMTNSVVYAIKLMRYGLSHAHMKSVFEHMLLLPTPITHAVRLIFSVCTDCPHCLQFLSPYLLGSLLPESILILVGMIFTPLTTLNILLYLNLMIYTIKLSVHFVIRARATMGRFASQLVALSARYRKTFATITVVLETAYNAAVLGAFGLLTGTTPLMLIETLGLLLAQSISRKSLAIFFNNNSAYEQRLLWTICLNVSVLSLSAGMGLLLGKLGSSLLWGISLPETMNKVIPILRWTGIFFAGSLLSLPGLMNGCLALFNGTWYFSVCMFIEIENYHSYRSMIRREKNLFKRLKFFDAHPHTGNFLSPLMQNILKYSSYISAIALFACSLLYALSWVVVWTFQSIPYLRLSVYWLLHPTIAALPFALIFTVAVLYFLFVSILWLTATTPKMVHAMYRAQLRLFDWMVSRYAFRDTLHKHKYNLLHRKHIDIPKNEPTLSKEDKQTITQALSSAKSNAYTLDITHTDSAPYLANGYLQNQSLKTIFLDLSDRWPNKLLQQTQDSVHWGIHVPPCYTSHRQRSTQNGDFTNRFQSEIKRLHTLCQKLPNKEDLLANIENNSQTWLSKHVLWYFQSYHQHCKQVENLIGSIQNADTRSLRQSYERILCSTLNKMHRFYGKGFTAIQQHIDPQMENPWHKLIAYYKNIPIETRDMANFSDWNLRHLTHWAQQLETWPQQLLSSLITYNDTLDKEHYCNPQKIGARIGALITKLGYLPKSITLIGSNGVIAGEQTSYRAQIMNAIRKKMVSIQHLD